MAADDQDAPDLADPKEHPEQHAALQTEKQGAAEPQTDTDNEALDSEEHSDDHGPFGTG
jgi:hypothetical protein